MRFDREEMTILLCFSALLLISFVCFIGPWGSTENTPLKKDLRLIVTSKVAGTNTKAVLEDSVQQRVVYPFNKSEQNSYIFSEDYEDAIRIGSNGINIDLSKARNFDPVFIMTNDKSQIRTANWLGIVRSKILQIKGQQGFNLRVIFSFDNRATWMTYLNGSWHEIDWAGANINGISEAELIKISSKGWQAKGGFVPGVTETVDIGLVVIPNVFSTIRIPEFNLVYKSY